MAKNTTITTVDGLSVEDDIGKKPSIKMIHEKAFQKFGIDPTKSYNGIGLKSLDEDSRSQIILNNINSINNNLHDSININLKNRTISMGFTSKKTAELFMNEFHSNLFKSVNQFLEENGKNPKHYDRGLILSHELQGSDKGATVVISY